MNMCISVDNCCCFIGLDVGTKIIGFFQIIVAVCAIALYAPSVVLGELPQARLIFYSAMVASALLEIVFGALLLRAAYKRKPQQTWPWLVLSWTKGVGITLLTLGGIALLAYRGDLETTAELSCIISVYFVYAILLLYFTSVVNSRRQEMVLDNYWATKRLLQHAKNQYYYV